MEKLWGSGGWSPRPQKDKVKSPLDGQQQIGYTLIIETPLSQPAESKTEVIL